MAGHDVTGRNMVARTFARLGLVALMLAPLAGQSAQAVHHADTHRPVMRISTENSAAHVQTRMVRHFAEALQARVGERLSIIHEYDAILFRDRDVVRALQQGQVEMAVPGTWQLDRLVPPVGALLMPALYGLDTATTHRLRDGMAGRTINRALEHQLDVVVAGRWIDLGHAHIYTTKRPVDAHADLEGLVIRIAGGDVNAARLRGLGMIPVVVPWPDLPASLGGGRLDGIMTTHETAVSGRLWEHGIRYAFEDRQYFAQYIPLVSARFWSRLPADLRDAITETWDAVVDDARAEAARAQAAARETLRANGVRIVAPTNTALARRRADLARTQGPMVEGLGLDGGFIEAVLREAGLIQ